MVELLRLVSLQDVSIIFLVIFLPPSHLMILVLAGSLTLLLFIIFLMWQPYFLHVVFLLYGVLIIFLISVKLNFYLKFLLWIIFFHSPAVTLVSFLVYLFKQESILVYFMAQALMYVVFLLVLIFVSITAEIQLYFILYQEICDVFILYVGVQLAFLLVSFLSMSLQAPMIWAVEVSISLL